MTNLSPKKQLAFQSWQSPWQKGKVSSWILLLVAFLSLNIGQAAAQQRTISGTVTGDGTAPLIGVSVVLKGTTTATATDVNGKFSLPVTGNTGTLVFSYIGYVSQEIPVGASSTYNVNLLTDARALDEVVIVGYGTQRKTDLTGSVAAVSERDFNPGQNTTPDQLIQGKVAGVQITSNGGAPGSGSTIRIRGGASLNANNDPLIVIDGVPVDNQAVSGAPNPLSLINPNDIESFNILKDASATAIYGSRASNGVIIITTKKGASGEAFRLSFNTVNSLSKVKNTVDVLSADEFRAAVTEGRGTNGAAGNANLLGSSNTNWQDQIFQDAFTTDNNLSASGSYKKLPYRVSVGYLDQEGILKTSSLKRTSVALNLNPSFLDDHLKVNFNVKGSMTKSRYADEGAIGAAIAFDPTQPVYMDNQQFGGYYEWLDASGKPNTLAPRNPLSLLEQRKDNGEAKRSIGNLQLDYKFHFLPELRANLNVGYDISKGQGTVFRPITMASVFNQGGSRSEYEQTKTNKLADFYLNYAKELTAIDSRFDVTAGYSYQNFLIKTPAFPVLTEAGTVFAQAGIPGQNENTLIGFFGRINYALKDKYLLTANIRRDGSSRFAEGNKWGTFPSLALAWRISEESFLKNSSLVNDLKLRFGYGITGQQDISNDYYPFLARYSFSEGTALYPFGDQYYSTLRPAGYDVNIKWEETTQYNAGLDFGFFEGRISGTIDVYKKKTKDLLAYIFPAAGTNLTNGLTTNVGSLESKGFEAALNFSAISKENLTWDFGFNGTIQDVKILSLSKVNDPNSPGTLVGGVSGGTGTTVQINSIGYTPYSFYLYKQVYDENGSPLEGVYEDLNHDGQINEKDLYRYKAPQPKVYLGFNSNLTYKQWNLALVMRANLGNYVYNNIYSNMGTYSNISNATYLVNMSSNVLQTNFVNPRYVSDYYVENASFLRMDNITLGYNFGKVYRDKVNLRLTANAQNVFVITNYSGLDPEVSSGIDNNFYPRPRVFALGANLEF
ncbi:SusC/RagA family TonB-linked outer membrane protein [Rufibacter sediminis]|uniref:TonB-dependent receptor n=1 Tax=Rufibacter sediminis TaxID=2762756 RepID=A0ABR6VYJ9_9BACT|nr:TonB-dependent receptor [Rufibacter sediminis]MBC3542282.1 TonB-dependent receptor [Rufibacter sediminis]